MNQRIKELAKQSGLIQYDTDSKMNDVEKFAELVIQECINLAQEAQRNHDDADWYIQQHFGVK